MSCPPLLCVSRSGVPARQRPLHACSLRLPRRLLHAFPGPDGGRQRGEHVGGHLRRGVQPLGQRAAHARGRARSRDAIGSPPERLHVQRGRAEGGRGGRVEGGARGGRRPRQESAARGQEQAVASERRGGAQQVRPERVASLPGDHRTAVRPPAAPHHADGVGLGHCLPERHPQDA